MDSSLSDFLGMFVDGKGGRFKTASIFLALSMPLTIEIEAIWGLSLIAMGISVGIELLASVICMIVGFRKDNLPKRHKSHHKKG